MRMIDELSESYLVKIAVSANASLIQTRCGQDHIVRKRLGELSDASVRKTTFCSAPSASFHSHFLRVPEVLSHRRVLNVGERDGHQWTDPEACKT